MSEKKISSSDKALFRQATADVKPIKPNMKRERQQTPSKISIPKYLPTDNVLKEDRYLSDYINPPVSDHTILSYQHHPLPAKRMKQLKNGDIPYQARLDLHGFQGDEAKSRLLNFLLKAKEQGKRCVLIIHGKGNYGSDPPRIKNLVNVWLPQLPEVLAFYSAKPKHGGTGAVYVLLKR